MARYIATRILSMISTLFGVVTLVFLIMRLVPGDFVDTILAQGDTTEEVEKSLRAFFGLDRPIWVQYADFLSGLARLDFGISWKTRFPTTGLILQALPVTLQLAVMAALLSPIVGVGFGTLSAMNENTLPDHAIRVVSLFSLSIPVFWQSTMLILVLSLWLHWAPLGYVSPLADVRTNLLQMLLPAVCLGTSASASVMRMTRSCLLDVLRQDYVRTARAKGVGEGTIVIRHALKKALIPVVTIV